MRAVSCIEPGRLALVERPDPGPPPAGWARIAIRHIGICGTDYHIFEGKHPYLAYPRVIGHELSAVVESAGAGVALAPGTEVAVNPYLACGTCIACRTDKPNCCMRVEVLGVHCDGGMAEAILMPAANLYPLAGLSLRDGAMVEFLAIGAHAVRRSQARAGASALVVGIGPIGLGTALFARIAGLDVTLMDASSERLAFAAEKLDLRTGVQAGEDAQVRLMEITAGEGFEVVFDATGNARAIEAGFAHVAHGGAYVLVSIVKDMLSFSDPEFHKREMMLIGSRNAQKVDFEHVMAEIGAGTVPLDALATHETRLEDVPRDMPRWTREKAGLVKALVAV